MTHSRHQSGGRQKSVKIERCWMKRTGCLGHNMPMLATQYCMRIEYSVTATGTRLTLSAEKGVGHWQEPKPNLHKTITHNKWIHRLNYEEHIFNCDIIKMNKDGSWDPVVSAWFFFLTVGSQTGVHKVGVSLWNHDWLNSPAHPSKSKNLKACFPHCCTTLGIQPEELFMCWDWHCDIALYSATGWLSRCVKAQLLTFYKRSIPSPWQWQALPSPLLLLPTSCEEFKRWSPFGLLLGPSTPLCYSVCSSWLTFSSKAIVKRTKEHKMCLATGVHTGHSLSHTLVFIRCKDPLSLQVQSAVRWAGIKAQSQERMGQRCDVVTQMSNTFLIISSVPQLPVHPLFYTLKGPNISICPFFDFAQQAWDI